MWMLYVVFYGASKGAREIFKKKAFQTLSVMDVLLVYTLLSAAFVCPLIPDSLGTDLRYIPIILFKAFIIFIAWLMGFTAVSKMPVSLYGVLDLSRVLFSTALGVILLKERPGLWGTLGLIPVCVGLLLLKVQPKKLQAEPKEKPAAKYVFMAFGCCFLNAVSGTMDKYLMANTALTENQLLVWYTLAMAGFYVVYVLCRKIKIDWKNALKTPWLYLMALTLVIGDKALFAANANPQSTVAVMTLLKQTGCLVIILGGRLVFKEKNIGYKLFCAALIVAGILMAALGK